MPGPFSRSASPATLVKTAVSSEIKSLLNTTGNAAEQQLKMGHKEKQAGWGEGSASTELATQV